VPEVGLGKISEPGVPAGGPRFLYPQTRCAGGGTVRRKLRPGRAIGGRARNTRPGRERLSRFFDWSADPGLRAVVHCLGKPAQRTPAPFSAPNAAKHNGHTPVSFFLAFDQCWSDSLRFITPRSLRREEPRPFPEPHPVAYQASRIGFLREGGGLPSRVASATFPLAFTSSLFPPENHRLVMVPACNGNWDRFLTANKSLHNSS